MRGNRETKNPADFHFIEDCHASFVEAFGALSRLARLKYTTILDIVTLTEAASSNNEQLQESGHGNFHEIQWRLSESEGDYGTGLDLSGGGTVFATNGQGRIGALVTITLPPEPMRAGSMEAQYAAHHVPVLCHELGHVDDFEKRINLVPTKFLDIAAVELYAHRYACKMMVRHDLRLSLEYYLDALVPNLAMTEESAMGEAAKSFLASEDCKMSNRFLGRE